MNHNIYNIFGNAVNSYPTNKAIISNKKSISYQELDYAIQHKADELLAKGIKKGDKILVFIPMSISLYVFLLATFKIGAVAVFVDEWANKKRLTDCLTKVPCKGFVGGTKARLLKFLYAPLRKIEITINSSIKTTSIPVKKAETVAQDETVLVTFTTGSTSIPKAANRTHEFLTAQYNILLDELKTNQSHCDFIGLPIVVLCNLGTGASSVLPNYNLKKLDKIKPFKVSRYLIDNKVNRIISSPSFFRVLANDKSISLSHTNEIFTGGAPVFPDDIPQFKHTFPKANINILYGSTEAEPISHILGEQLLKKQLEITTNGLPVGTPSNHVQLKLIKKTDKEILTQQDLKELSVKDQEVGEILVSGKHVLKEYLLSEEDTKKNKIKDGETVWHRTGDAGKLIDGQLYLLGRIKEIIIDKDELTSPFIYEYLLAQEKNIHVGTVLKTDVITAFIEPVSWEDRNQIKKNILKNHDKIKAVHFIKKIPLDPRHNAKIDYDKLRAIYS